MRFREFIKINLLIILCSSLSACFGTVAELASIVDPSSEDTSNQIIKADEFSVLAPSITKNDNVDVDFTPPASESVKQYVYGLTKAACEVGSSWTPYTGLNSIPIHTSNSTNQYWLKIKTNSERDSECKLITVNHDNQKPSVSFSSSQQAPASNLGISQGPEIQSGSLVDSNSGISKIEVRVHEYLGNKIVQTWTEVSAGQAVTGLSLNPGTIYYYQIRVTDSANNVSDRYALAPWSDKGISKIPVVRTSGTPVDIDGDGDEDLVNDEAILENLGNGLLLPIFLSEFSFGVYGWGDLDKDGDLDIFSTEPNLSEIYWFRNDGDMQFTKIDLGIISLDDKAAITVVDVDGDSDNDIVYATAIGIRQIVNDGSFNFTESNLASVGNVKYLNASDFDKDGHLDLLWNISTSSLENISYYPGSSSGLNTGSPVVINTDAYRMHMKNTVVVDLDGDNDLDIIYPSDTNGFGNRLKWARNDGSNTWSTATIDTLSINGFDTVHAGDFNSDGELDIIAYFPGENGLAYTQSSGSFTKLTGATYHDAYTGEPILNDDNGDSYILTTPRRYGSLFIHATSFEDYATESVATTVNSIPLDAVIKYVDYKDLDDDGKLDMVGLINVNGSYSYNSMVIVHSDYLNSSTQVEIAYEFSAVDIITSFSVADLDGDDDFDVVFSGQYTEDLYILRNNGDNTYTKVSSYTNSVVPVKILLTDVDGDTDLDILAVRNSDGYLMYYQNQGGLVFSVPSVAISYNFKLTNVAYGDYEGDGDLDAFAVKSGTQIHLYRNDSGTFTDQGSIYTHGSNITYINAVNIASSDSNIDFLLKYWNLIGGTNVYHIVENTGSGYTSNNFATEYISDGIDPYGDVYDYDGDGDLDIIPSSNCFRYYENDGSWGFTEKYLHPGVPGCFGVEDIDGDSKLDVKGNYDLYWQSPYLFDLIK